MSITATQETPSTAGATATDAAQFNDTEQLQLVTFEVGKEEFAVDILKVQEINRMLEITSVPQSPPDVEGVINLRGRIIPVIELRRRFGMDVTDQNEDSRIIVVEVEGRVLGFIVDRVHEVLRIDRSIVEPAPRMVTSINSDYIEGVGKLDDRLLILVDLDRLFSNAEMRQIEQAVDQAS